MKKFEGDIHTVIQWGTYKGKQIIYEMLSFHTLEAAQRYAGKHQSKDSPCTVITNELAKGEVYS